MKNDDNCKYYIKQISHLLPLHTKKERLFLNELKDSVMRFTEETEDCSFDLITERFGKPLDVVHDYLSSLGKIELQQALYKSRLVKGCILAAMIGILIILFVIWLYEYLDYRHQWDNNIVLEEIIVEQSGSWE